MRRRGVVGAVMMALVATAAPALAPAGAIADEVCPENLDLAVKNGASEPEGGQFCYPAPKTGRSVCSRGTRLPSRLTLTLTPSAGGVALGSSRSGVCSRWGRPVIQMERSEGRRTWVYGSAAPDRDEYVAWERANNKMAWIISWCRYRWDRPEPCREDDRRAAAASGGALGRLLEYRPPQSANWVAVNFNQRGRVGAIYSWRPSDRTAGNLRPGSTFPESERCPLLGASRSGTCHVGPNRVRGSLCTTGLVTNTPPLQGILHSGFDGRLDHGTRVRTVGLSGERYGPSCGDG